MRGGITHKPTPMDVVHTIGLVLMATALASFGVWVFVFTLYQGFTNVSAGVKKARRQALLVLASMGMVSLVVGIVLMTIEQLRNGKSFTGAAVPAVRRYKPRY